MVHSKDVSMALVSRPPNLHTVTTLSTVISIGAANIIDGDVEL